MSYAFLEHTADVRMRVTAASLEDLFRDALAGTMALLDPRDAQPTQAVQRRIALAAPDVTALLVDFLNGALLEAVTQRECYDGAAFQLLTQTGLDAALSGRAVAAFGAEIKAVTYHEADVRRTPAGAWETLLVFDI
jgi:SHS2 domain-containing protein